MLQKCICSLFLSFLAICLFLKGAAATERESILSSQAVSASAKKQLYPNTFFSLGSTKLEIGQADHLTEEISEEYYDKSLEDKDITFYEVSEYKHDGQPKSFLVRKTASAIAADNNYLCIAHTKGNFIEVLDRATWKTVKNIAIAKPGKIKIYKNKIYVEQLGKNAQGLGIVQSLSAITNNFKNIKRIIDIGRPCATSFHFFNDLLYVGYKGRYSIIDTNSGECVYTREVGSNKSSVAFSSCGTCRFLLNNEKSTISIINRHNPQQISTCLSVNPIATLMQDNVLYVQYRGGVNLFDLKDNTAIWNNPEASLQSYQITSMFVCNNKVHIADNEYAFILNAGESINKIPLGHNSMAIAVPESSHIQDIFSMTENLKKQIGNARFSDISLSFPE